MNRKEQIKAYLERLGEGEALESVRADFVKEFQGVDAGEILLAEQALLKEGTPWQEVQRLCDVHSAFFHEKIEEEETEISEGHPLDTLLRENRKLEGLLAEGREAIKRGAVGQDLLAQLREISVHYAKKGDLLYPHLKVKYGISGPSAVMWTSDDEIRDELAALAKKKEQDEEWLEEFERVLVRMEEMIYKEEKILFPNCVRNFTRREWYGIYQDAKDYGECFGVGHSIWEAAEKEREDRIRAEKNRTEQDDTKVDKPGKDGSEESKAVDGKNTRICLGGGSMTIEQLEAMLNTIPLEITFVDEQDRNRYFNAGSKVFKRPSMALGREVYSCHPPKIEQQVRRIIEEFRAGTMDRVPIWMDKNGRKMLVTYYAVRNAEKEYLGTLELVQDMEFARNYFTVNGK